MNWYDQGKNDAILKRGKNPELRGNRVYEIAYELNLNRSIDNMVRDSF